MGKSVPRLCVPVGAATRRCINAYVARVGFGRAVARLGVGQETLHTARAPGGALAPDTIARLLARLELEGFAS
jgi:hypothetical protein